MKQIWSKKELKENWTLSNKEKLIISKRKEIFRLVFAIRLKFFENYGYALEEGDEIPNNIVQYIKKQIDYSSEEIPEYRIEGFRATESPHFYQNNSSS